MWRVEPVVQQMHGTTSPVDDAAAAGVEGNSRLTSITGLVLVVMLAIEGYTILDVHGLITLHIFLGIMLIAPVLLKSASTIYRFARYDGGAAPYVRKGPPHPILRIIGPLVIVSSLLVLGSGAGLLAVSRGGDNTLLTVHKASFIVWIALMTVHVLGLIRGAAVDGWREIRPVRDDLSARRRPVRLVLVVLVLLVGAGAAALVLPSASGWTNRSDVGHHRPR
jgi:hypothetical protein